MTKIYITIEELANITGYSYHTAGNIIRALNGELKEKGIVTFRGKISKEYLQKRLNIVIE